MGREIVGMLKACPFIAGNNLNIHVGLPNEYWFWVQFSPILTKLGRGLMESQQISLNLTKCCELATTGAWDFVAIRPVF